MRPTEPGSVRLMRRLSDVFGAHSFTPAPGEQPLDSRTPTNQFVEPARH